MEWRLWQTKAKVRRPFNRNRGWTTSPSQKRTSKPLKPHSKLPLFPLSPKSDSPAQTTNPTAPTTKPNNTTPRLPAAACPVHFSLSSIQTHSLSPLAVKFGGQITYSRTAVQVEKAAMELLKTIEAKKKEVGQNAVGFDIEWRPSFKRGVPPGKAAVMQMCVDTSCHVMHIVHSGIPQSLQLIIEDTSILKVGLGIGGDSVKVYKDYNVSTKAVDLLYLAKRKLGGVPKNWGLASLTEKLICKQLLKPNKIRLGNWEAKCLSKEQLEYAAIDAFTCWSLYEELRSLPDAEKVTAENQSEEPQPVSL